MQIKILIVDDDLKIVTMLSKTFTTMLQGYLVLTATSANAGLNMLKSERPDVVVLDVRLGPESGMDLLRDFNNYLGETQQRRPRFIVITAYADEKVKKEALETYKVDAYLIKPFDPKEIRYRVAESISKILETEMKGLSVYAKRTTIETDDHKKMMERKLEEGLREIQ